MNANLTVHAFMYAYFACQAVKIRLPNAVRMFVTIIQLVQFALASIGTGLAVLLTLSGDECSMSARGLGVSLTLALCYLGLFSNFFYEAYVAKKSKMSDKVKVG